METRSLDLSRQIEEAHSLSQSDQSSWESDSESYELTNQSIIGRSESLQNPVYPESQISQGQNEISKTYVK